MGIEPSEGPFYCDVENPIKRMDYLRRVFSDVEQATQGVFTKKDVASARRVLDLGMGRGAVGGVVKEFNPDCQLVGVDSEDYQGETLYPLYDRRIRVGLTTEDFWRQIKDEKDFDLIISVGLPPQVTSNLIRQSYYGLKRLMSQKGVCILISDTPYDYDPIGRWYKPFTLFKGSEDADISIFIFRKLTQQSIPSEELKQVLQNKHGVVFFPKRDLEIPKIPDEKISSLVGDKNLVDVQKLIQYLVEFLGGQAVGDKWGKNHDGRMEWTEAMAQKYGSGFVDLYHENNQFRGNSLSVTRFTIDILRESLEICGHHNLADKLKKIHQEMSTRLQNYNQLESLDDKLKVVQFFEDKILETLQLLTMGLPQYSASNRGG